MATALPVSYLPGRIMPTLAAYLAAWQSEGGHRYVGHRWNRVRSGLIRVHALPLLGEVKLDQIMASHVWQLQQSALEHGLSATSINRLVFGALAALLRDAEATGVLAPGFRRRLLSAVRTLPEMRSDERGAFTRAERDQILAASAIAYRPFFAWLFATGMRPGEALGLRWADLDLPRRTCRIERSRDGQTLTACKTRASQRVIRLAEAAVAAVGQIRPQKPCQWVFLGPRGSPLDLHNLTNRVWPRTLNCARVSFNKLYCTRHSWITWQLEAGRPAAAVARAAGTSVAVIERHYLAWTRALDADDWDAAL